MHELSLCRSVADVVTANAEGRTVTSIRLQVGHLRQVIPETLQFCWTMHTDGGPLAGSVLDIDYIPAIIRCQECGTTTELSVPVRVCGQCSSTSVTLESGEEFMIESIDLEKKEVTDG